MKILYLTFILLVLLHTSTAQIAQPYCDTDGGYFDNMNLYAEQGETMHYWLFEYFRGFNLTFSYNVSDNLDATKNSISVTQGLNLINSTKFTEPVVFKIL